MQKFADFDQDGMPLGFYSTDISGPRMLPVFGVRPEPTKDEPDPETPIIGEVPNAAYPPGVVEISGEQWKELLDNTGHRRWNGVAVVVFVPDAIVQPAPKVISDRQFFTQLALDGVISEAEAEATSDGTMPALLMGILDAIPDATERFKARMLVKNATTFDITQPLVAIVAGALQWGPARLEKLWLNASKL